MAMNFALQVILVQTLGIDRYGTIGFLLNGYGILYVLLTLNLNISAIRFGAEALGRGDES